jgi:hypothetical protein
MSANMQSATAVGSASPVISVAGRDRGALGFVLTVWLAMLAAALTLVAVYGSNVPSWDDWDMVPTMTGHQPVTLEWLWSQHNEHRVPVPRLLMLAMVRWIAFDFRTGMYFNVLATSALALGMVFANRRIRGTSSYLDAFFPVVLLNWSQAANFLWCWQVEFYASMLLAATILTVMARSPTPPKGATAIAAGVCLVLLPLCGANGLGLVPLLALWFGYGGVLHWRTATSAGRRDSIILIAFAVAAATIVGLYFIGYSKVPYHPSTHNPPEMLRTAVQFLTMGFGPGIVGLSFENRLPMPFWKIVCVAVVGLFLVTGWMLVTTWRKQSTERGRAAGLFLFLAAMALLGLAIGMGRNGFEIRYVTLSVPAVCAMYFAWCIYGTPRLQRLIRTLLFATAVVVLVPNTMWGLRYARDLRSNLGAFEADMVAGTPPYQLIQRYGGKYLHPHQLIVTDYMPFLRDSKVGAFRYLRDNPPFREVSIPLTPIESHDVEFSNGVARAIGMGGSLTFALPADVQVAGIRLRYTYSSSKPYLAIYWKSHNQPRFSDESYSKYSPTGDHANWGRISWTRLQDDASTVYVWVSQPVQMVRILAMSRATIDIRELTLLVPAETSQY